MKDHASGIMIGLAVFLIFGMLLATDIYKRHQDQQRLIDKINAINRAIP